MVKQPFPDGKFQPPVVKQRVPHAKFSLVKRHVYVAVVKGPVPDDKFHLPVVKRISYGKFPVTRFVTVCVLFRCLVCFINHRLIAHHESPQQTRDKLRSELHLKAAIGGALGHDAIGTY